MTAVIAGFYGKLPARGDFVRAALPRDFTDPWDGWLAGVMAASRAAMGNDWLPAFLESPVWRFALPAGLCGERAVLGLMLPSVDRAGRYFPLTFAALFADPPPSADSPSAGAWLDRCETAGRAALEEDAEPDRLNDMMGRPEMSARTDTGGNSTMQSVWWSDGSPRVPAGRLSLSGLPDAVTYATMLGAQAELEPPNRGLGGEAWERPS
ncbi:MAG TPA: type VI secretion system-associated protein TagF [Acetobacteraceae bacterium]|jgi:type VI secretion system protein ImpM